MYLCVKFNSCFLFYPTHFTFTTIFETLLHSTQWKVNVSLCIVLVLHRVRIIRYIGSSGGGGGVSVTEIFSRITQDEKKFFVFDRSLVE